MIVGQVEIWRDGKLVGHCHAVKDDPSGPTVIRNVHPPQPDGVYQLRNKEACNNVQCRNGVWTYVSECD
jgi:hypothetical protein